MSITATLKAARGTHYRREGGPWDGATLDSLLTDAHPVRVGAPRDAFVDGDIRLNAEDIDGLAACLAGGLRDRGVGRRDVVAWQLPNGYEPVILYRACWRLGAIAVPIHHQAGEAEVGRLLERVEPTVVVGAAHLPLGTHPDAIVVGGPSLPARQRRTPATADDADNDAGKDAPPDTPHAVKSGAPFAKLLAADPEFATVAQSSDVAVVLFTAGSTGDAKGVIHTHRTLAAKARSMPARHGLTGADVVLMPAPLAHISGLLNGILVPSVVGMTSILMPKWNTALALDLIERERVSFMVGPPTFFLGLTADTDFAPKRVRSLRLISTGGAGVTPAFVETAKLALHARVKRAYGSTEAPTVTTCDPDDDEAKGRDTDGRATGDTELRIVNPATGDDCDPGTAGELWVRGPELFGGYLDASQNNAAVARGGWFRTGDLAVIDQSGWLTITGRMKDLIIRGGENIATSEIEAILEAHPGVRQAVAIGYPDERLGERVAVFVVAESSSTFRASSTFDLAACRAWFEAQGIAKFKTPERVIVVDELPTLAAGKPDRVALRARLEHP